MSGRQQARAGRYLFVCALAIWGSGHVSYVHVLSRNLPGRRMTAPLSRPGRRLRQRACDQPG
eukprot:scaffold7214_cov410-Prasinococcus_capsulatus_cf.AAC.5